AMLVYVAFVLGRNFKGLLIGAGGAPPEDAERIREIAASERGIDEVLDVRWTSGRARCSSRCAPTSRTVSTPTRSNGSRATSSAGSARPCPRWPSSSSTPPHVEPNELQRSGCGDDRDARQLLALEQLERRAAAGGGPRDAVEQAELVQRPAP